MGVPRQDMRLILPALASLAGAWLAMCIADWQSIRIWGACSLLAGLLLLIAVVWIARRSFQVLGRIMFPIAIIIGVCGSTCLNISYHHPRVLASYDEKQGAHRTASVYGTIASRAEEEQQAWSGGTCSMTVAVEEVEVGQRRLHYRSSSLPLITGLARQLGYPSHSPVTVQLRSAECEALIGQKISAYGTLSAMPGSRKEAAQIFVKEMSLDGSGTWAAQRVRDINLSLTRLLETRPTHLRGLLPGVALGDDTRVSAGLSEAMRMTQLTHLIAVSGGHVSILMGIVLSLVGRKRRFLAALLCFGAVGALIILVGPQASVIRACLMAVIIVLALARGRASQASAAWSVAIMATALFHPWLALSYGFLLSASATIGIVLVGVPLARHLQSVFDTYAEWASHKLNRTLPRIFSARITAVGREARRHTGRATWLEKFVTFAAYSIAIPLAAQIFCTPILLLFTSEGSIWSVAANALVAPVVAPLTVFGLLTALCAPVFPSLAVLLSYPAQACTWWIDSVACHFAELYGSGIPVTVAGAMCLCLLGAVISARRQKIAAMCLSPVVLLVCFQWWQSPNSAIPDDWQIIQCDVGQGSALLARVDGQTIMVDVGGEDGNVGRCLREAEVEHIDLLIISHLHDDHVGGLPEVLGEASVGQIWVSPNREPAENWEMLTRQAEAVGVPVEAVWRGHSWGQHLHILSPQACPSGDANADSLVVQIDTAGGVLVMGDADGEIQVPIASRVEHVRTVVIAHHGSSRQEDALAQAAKPEIALISVGENTYGHPSDTALRVYREADIYDTLSCGRIAVTDTEVFSECLVRAVD